MSSYLNASTDKKINQYRLHLGLPALEVITTDQRVLLDGKLNQPCSKQER
jgi:hypothetical protein